MSIGVLVEHSLACSSAHRFRLGGVGEQITVGGACLFGVFHDQDLRAGLEPALDAVVRVRDDRRTGGGELERPARRRCVDGCMGAARDAEVDTRCGDRTGECVERNVAGHASVADISLKIAPAEREVDVGQRARGLTDERLHPLTPELVAVAVEEHVHLLLDLVRREEIGVGPPEDRFGAPGTQLAQSLETSFGVRDDEVVLGRIGLVVPVEARVHPAELGQAHRHVAVVEDDRHAVALAEVGRDAAQVRHRHGEDHNRVRALVTDQPVEVPAPARSHPPPDRLAGHPLAESILGVVLGPPQVRVALEPRDDVARPRERLSFEKGRVGGSTPPRRLDGTSAVGRDDEIDAFLIEALPELPPRGSAAVTEIEVDGRGGDEQLHAWSVSRSRYEPVRTAGHGAVDSSAVLAWRAQRPLGFPW